MDPDRSIRAGWLVALGILCLAVIAVLALMGGLAYSQRDDLWPLPGLFMLIAALAAVAGWVGAWLRGRGKREAGGLTLMVSGGVLLGSGVVGIWTVGGYLLPLAAIFLALGMGALWARWRRLLLGLVLSLGVGGLTAIGVPYLDRLGEIGATPLSISETVPDPGAREVPLDTTVSVRSKSLESDGPVTTSMQIVYMDEGLFWWRAQPEGKGSGSWDGRLGQGSWTFTPQGGFEPCREVRVGVAVSGYRSFRFRFQTACPG